MPLHFFETNLPIKHGAVRFGKVSWSRTSGICLFPPPCTRITNVRYFCLLCECLGFMFSLPYLFHRHSTGLINTSQAPSKTLFIFQNLKLIKYFVSTLCLSSFCKLLFHSFSHLYMTLDTAYKQIFFSDCLQNKQCFKIPLLCPFWKDFNFQFCMNNLILAPSMIQDLI